MPKAKRRKPKFSFHEKLFNEQLKALAGEVKAQEERYPGGKKGILISFHFSKWIIEAIAELKRDNRDLAGQVYVLEQELERRKADDN